MSLISHHPLGIRVTPLAECLPVFGVSLDSFNRIGVLEKGEYRARAVTGACVAVAPLVALSRMVGTGTCKEDE